MLKGAQLLVRALFSHLKMELRDAHAHEVHGIVNNAGILRDGLLVKVKDGEIDKRMSLAEWQAVIDVNLTGVHNGLLKGAKYLASQGGGWRQCILDRQGAHR